ncbi:flagellar filament capping protein FliD [Paenibacillus thailandensis]|uniref:Flagellar hook-associated protein 2 n=1 Tax=Paenibacillus thailandensis TaxID=393250 RepID=A0ABW5R3X5_9BACL
MRISGLASGLDVDSMVKELMKASQTKYDNMVKKRTLVEWKQEDYRSMAAKIVDFRNNKLASFNLTSAISAKTSEVSGDTDAVKINSTSSTASGSLNVSVQKVATAATNLYTFSGGTTTTTTNADGTTTTAEKSLAELGFTTTADGKVNITINNETLTLDSTATLSDVATTMNGNTSKYKATAIYDAASGKFSITGTQTGASSLSVSGFAGTVSNVTTGQDAKITVNGISYKQASNSFSVNGFNFTVQAQTAAGSYATITAVQDTSKIVETIKSFVTEYNNLISAVNSELSEVRDYDYNPLTSDEKEEMTEDEIELWEKKARSGTLHNDSTLSTMISELRTAATSLVAGIKDANGNSISIGITTGSYSEKGKLILDETKLKSALESNPDEVINLFTATSSDTSVGSTTSGVFAKMMDSTMDALKSLSTTAGTSMTSTDLTTSFLESSLLSEQIRDMKEREDREQDRLTDLENRYYSMFTAMETAINKYNSQASVITNLFSS